VAMAMALLVARLVATALMGSSGGCGDGNVAVMVTTAEVMSVAARAKAMAFAVVIAL
jgi:hypothetical protein